MANCDEKTGDWQAASECAQSVAGDWQGELCGEEPPEIVGEVWEPDIDPRYPQCDYPDPGDPKFPTGVLEPGDFTCAYIGNQEVDSTYQPVAVASFADVCGVSGTYYGTPEETWAFASPANTNEAYGVHGIYYQPWDGDYYVEYLEGINLESNLFQVGELDRYIYWYEGLDEVFWMTTQVEYITPTGTYISDATVEIPIALKGFRRYGTFFMSHALVAEVRNQGAGPSTVWIIDRKTGNTPDGDTAEEVSTKARLCFAMVNDGGPPLNFADCTLNLNGHSDPSDDRLFGVIHCMDGKHFLVFTSDPYPASNYAQYWSLWTISASSRSEATLTCVDSGTVAVLINTVGKNSIPTTSNGFRTDNQWMLGSNLLEIWYTNSQSSAGLWMIDPTTKVLDAVCSASTGLLTCDTPSGRTFQFEQGVPYVADGGMADRRYSGYLYWQRNVPA